MVRNPVIVTKVPVVVTLSVPETHIEYSTNCRNSKVSFKDFGFIKKTSVHFEVLRLPFSFEIKILFENSNFCFGLFVTSFLTRFNLKFHTETQPRLRGMRVGVGIHQTTRQYWTPAERGK